MVTKSKGHRGPMGVLQPVKAGSVMGLCPIGAEIAKYEDTDEDNIIGKLNLPNSPQTDGDKDQNDGKDGRSNNVYLRLIDHMPHKKGHSNDHE
jgi:hypothetical protein